MLAVFIGFAHAQTFLRGIPGVNNRMELVTFVLTEEYMYHLRNTLPNKFPNTGFTQNLGGGGALLSTPPPASTALS